MNLLKKIFLVGYYFFLNIKNFIVFFIILFLYKLNIYLRFFEKSYLLLIYRLNQKNKINLALNLSEFFIIRKSRDLFNAYFLYAFFFNRGDIYSSIKLQQSFLEYQKMLKKILKIEDTIIVSPNYYNKLGHFASISLFIKAIKLGLIKEKKILIIGPKSNYNQVILEKFLNFKEVKYLDQNNLEKKIKDNIDILNKSLDFHEVDGKILDFIQFLNLINKAWERKNKNNFFTYSKKEVKKANLFFKDIGINLNKNWYVLLHVRSTPDDNFAHRNSDITNYKKAVEFITSKGGFVVRIGDRSMKKLEQTKNLIDLTNHPNQSDYLLSLYHNSKFLMTGISGPGFMTTLFKNPCLHVDVGQMYEIVGKEYDYCLPRMFFQKGKILSLNKRIKQGLGQNLSLSFLKELKIISLPNSENEILDATKEIYFHVVENKKFKDSKLRKSAKKNFINNNLTPFNISRIIEKKYKNFFVNQN